MVHQRGVVRGPALHWLSHWAIEHWPSIAIVLVSTAVTYLATLSDWMAKYGPVAWGVLGVLTALTLSLSYWLFRLAQSHASITKFTDDRRNTSAVSPLDKHFAHKRLNVSDFFHPFYKEVEHVQFEHCDLFGPALVMADSGTTYSHCEFHSCEVVLMNPTARTIGATKFSTCLFSNCRFFRVTFVMLKSDYLHIASGGVHLPVISDGTCGDVETWQRPEAPHRTE